MNTLWIDHKYVNLASSHLSLFKRKDRNLYNMRCPFCGDSSKNKNKARGYFFEREGRLIYRCHNCGCGYSLKNFLRNIDPVLFQEYSLEVYKESSDKVDEDSKFVSDITKFAKRRIDKFDVFQDLKKISQLEVAHPAKKYVEGRKIPSNQHYRLYYCPRFYHWVNKHLPGKFKKELEVQHEHPRLILPFIDENGYVFGFQGRSFVKNDSLRYITILLDENRDKVFGLENVDSSKKVYVVEGPIDSLFVENCIAMAGSDSSFVNRLDKNNVVYIYDNEPRNKEIVSRIDKAIDSGYNVVIWPEEIKVKDINDMIMMGLSQIEIQSIIDNNTFSGLSARMKLNTWKR